LFKSWFGAGAGNKRIPEWIMLLDKAMLKVVIEAMWEGDGTRTKFKARNRYRESIDYGTVSKTLSYQLFLCLLKLRVLGTITREAPRGFRKKPIFYRVVCGQRRFNPFFIEGGRYVLVSIRSIERKAYSGKVYNLKLEHGNAYFCGIVARHSDRHRRRLEPAVPNTSVRYGISNALGTTDASRQ
jgi:intein/homing endonuclease